MIKIGHVKELGNITLPDEVMAVIEDAVGILDDAYGECRNIDRDDGGYVLIVESASDMESLYHQQIDLKMEIPEYVDRIDCSDGRVYISALVLISNDFGIVIIMPMEFLAYTQWKVSS